MNTRVVHLGSNLELHYSLPPKDAVIAAYAQFEKKDYNTWQYEKYASLVTYGRFSVSCGDYCALL